MVKDPQARTSLQDVRQALQPLLPAAEEVLFDREWFDRVDTADTTPEPAEVSVDSLATPLTEASELSMPALAVDPGPLPFAPRPEPAPEPEPARSRRRLLPVLVGVLAVLLFFVAAGGGFALARVAGGKPLLPPEQPPAPTSQTAAPLQDLVEVTADAASLNGPQNGGFAVSVPKDWTKFVEERPAKKLPASRRIHLVSPDGTQELTVEWIPGFYPKHNFGQYVDEVAANWPDDGFGKITEAPITALGEGGPESAQEFSYRTIDKSTDKGRKDQNRTTFARAYPLRDALWVVGLTVPTERQDSARDDLYARTVPTFRVAS